MKNEACKQDIFCTISKIKAASTLRTSAIPTIQPGSLRPQIKEAQRALLVCHFEEINFRSLMSDIALYPVASVDV